MCPEVGGAKQVTLVFGSFCERKLCHDVMFHSSVTLSVLGKSMLLSDVSRGVDTMAQGKAA